MVLGPILTARQLARAVPRLRHVVIAHELAATTGVAQTCAAHATVVVCSDRPADAACLVAHRPSASRRSLAAAPRRSSRRRRHRPRGQLHDPGSRLRSSIAGRRASGFLQVSLSKVPRHRHRRHTRSSRAEALPMNASDFSGPIRSAAICRDLAGCYAGRPIEVSRATASSNKCL